MKKKYVRKKHSRHKTAIGTAAKKVASMPFSEFFERDAQLFRMGKGGQNDSMVDALVLRAEPGSTVKIKFNSKGGASLSFIRNLLISPMKVAKKRKKVEVKHVN